MRCYWEGMVVEVEAQYPHLFVGEELLIYFVVVVGCRVMSLRSERPDRYQRYGGPEVYATHEEAVKEALHWADKRLGGLPVVILSEEEFTQLNPIMFEGNDDLDDDLCNGDYMNETGYFPGQDGDD